MSAHTTVTHTHLCARGRDGHLLAGTQTPGRKPVSGLEGQGLHPELYFSAQAAHGHSKSLGKSHSLLSSKPSTWALSIVLVHHRSYLPHAESGDLLGRHSTSPGLSLVEDKVVSSPLNTGHVLLPGPAPRC